MIGGMASGYLFLINNHKISLDIYDVKKVEIDSKIFIQLQLEKIREK